MATKQAKNTSWYIKKLQININSSIMAAQRKEGEQWSRVLSFRTETWWRICGFPQVGVLVVGERTQPVRTSGHKRFQERVENRQESAHFCLASLKRPGFTILLEIIIDTWQRFFFWGGYDCGGAGRSLKF